MRLSLRTALILAFGGLLAVTSFVGGTERAINDHIEGATVTYQVRDKHGQLVTVDVPSQSQAAIQVSSMIHESTGQTTGVVEATVMAVHGEDNTVTVHTQKGQKLVLAVSSASLSDMRPGERFTLLVPR